MKGHHCIPSLMLALREGPPIYQAVSAEQIKDAA